MPTVPRYSAPQKELGPLRAPTASPEAFGAGVGQALRRVGGEASDLGETLAWRAEQLRKQEDAAAAMRAYTGVSDQIRQYTLDPEKGVYSRRGAQAQGVYPEAETRLDEIYQGTLPSLTNPDQRRAFDALWSRRRESELDSIARHAAKENQSYRDQTASALVESSVVDAVGNFTNPAAVDTALRAGEAAIRANAQGQPLEAVDFRLRQFRSKVHAGIVERMANDSSSAALAYLHEHRDDIDGSAQATLFKGLKAGVTKETARSTAQAIMSGSAGEVEGKIAAQAQLAGVDPVTALTIARLENAPLDPKAKNPASSAHGIFQVIDGTWTGLGGSAADRGNVDRQVELGVKNLAQTRAALVKSLGREPEPWEIYIGHQQGSGTKLLQADRNALATTVAGMKEITKNGGSATSTVGEFLDTWKSRYAAAAARVKVPTGDPADRATASDMGLAQQLAAADQIADPEVREQAKTQILTENARLRAGAEARERGLREQAWSALDKNPSLDAIPPSVWNNLPVRDQQSIEAFLKRRAKDEDVKTDLGTYDRLNRMLGDDPEKFIEFDLLTVRDKLSASDWKQMSDKQQTAAARDEKARAKRTSVRTTNQLADDALRQMGIPPTSKEPAQISQAALFRRRVQENVDELEEAEGRKAKPAEVQEIVDKLSIRGTIKGSGWLWDSEKRAFELEPGEKGVVDSIDDIPAGVLAQARDVFGKRGKKPKDKDLIAFVNAYAQGDDEGMAAALEGAK